MHHESLSEKIVTKKYIPRLWIIYINIVTLCKNCQCHCHTYVHFKFIILIELLEYAISPALLSLYVTEKSGW